MGCDKPGTLTMVGPAPFKGRFAPARSRTALGSAESCGNMSAVATRASERAWSKRSRAATSDWLAWSRGPAITWADGASGCETEQRKSYRDCDSLHDPLPFCWAGGGD